MKCRHCKSDVNLILMDLGSAPPSNAYLTNLTLRRPEKWFPLKVLVCEHCWLVQTEDYSRASELFNEEYAYFSSFSDSWVQHASDIVDTVVDRFGLSNESLFVELASNDGYLLQFVQQRGIPCVGIEPTASTASAARLKGIRTIERFFGVQLAEELVSAGSAADFIIGINVLAHVPDINDFVSGARVLLKPNGVCLFEFPHVLRLIEDSQFDTIYHEHFSYLSFSTVRDVFLRSGLEIFDVEQLDTHGGSLRVFAQVVGTGMRSKSSKVDQLLQLETQSGIHSRDYYLNFSAKAEKIKYQFLAELLAAKEQGLQVVGYGAAAKGNTLMNFAGVRPDLIRFVADRNTSKQGKWMPGSRIPIVSEEFLKEARPNIIVVLPWNLCSEIVTQLDYVREWGAQFLLLQPEVRYIKPGQL